MNLTKFACEGNEVLSERLCRRAGRHGSTAGETPAATMRVVRLSMNLKKFVSMTDVVSPLTLNPSPR